MTEENEGGSARRKPPQMKFRTWIDQQVSDAERRGVFDNLPGKGKPLNLKPGAADGDYGAAWARDYARREGVAPAAVRGGGRGPGPPPAGGAPGGGTSGRPRGGWGGRWGGGPSPRGS